MKLNAIVYQKTALTSKIKYNKNTVLENNIKK